MRSRVTRFVFALALSLVALTVDAAGVPVQTLDGKRAGLGEFLAKDKWTLIMVWTTYCGVCRGQYPTMSAFHAAHKDKDAVVLGVSLDGYDMGDKIKAYQAEHAQNFPSVMTSPEDFTEKYERTTGERFTGTPTYLLFDTSGTLRAFLDGPITIAAIEDFMRK